MKTLNLIFLLLFIATGCSPNYSVVASPTIISQTNQRIDTARPLPTTTSAPEIIETQQPTPISTRSNQLEKQCIAISDTKSTDAVTTSGHLIIDPRIFDPSSQEDVYVLNPETLEQSQLLQIDNTIKFQPSIYTISPSREHFLFFRINDTSETQLYIGTIDGSAQQSAYWDSSWGDVAFWLNDNQLFIPPNLSHQNAIVLNPFTGIWEEAISEFPRPLNTSFPYFFYNSTLSQAIYVSGDNYVLWDANSNTDIWTKSTYAPYLTPAWAPDGTRAAMIIREENNILQNVRDELILIDSLGNEIQLTNFASIFFDATEIKITSVAWSPTGQSIAATLTIKEKSNDIPNSSLLIIDVSSQKVIDFCVPMINPSYIVWSPNGNQLAVNIPRNIEKFVKDANQPSIDNVSTILIDINKKNAVRIIDQPVVGWMR